MMDAVAVILAFALAVCALVLFARHRQHARAVRAREELVRYSSLTPRCERCARAVDRSMWSFDARREEHVVHVWCHGDHETRRVSIRAVNYMSDEALVKHFKDNLYGGFFKS